MNKYTKLIVAILIAQAAGVVGSLFTVDAINSWYLFLEKPTFSPPNWIFGPVWLTLYTLMGIAAWLIWMKYDETGSPQAKHAFTLFIVHLFFNALWSILFFGAQQIGLALINIYVLLGFIIILMMRFWRVDYRASYLLVPYFAWVSFASVLNFSLWVLN